MTLADDLAAALSESASTENAVNDTQFIRVTLKSIDADNKAIIRRLDADEDDGIPYPIMANSGYLAPNSTVWAMKTHGGLVIIGRIRTSEDNGQPPIGTIMQYAGANDPIDGEWFIADGRTISRTVYDRLFAVIGTTYGTGNGSTTFTLPDLRGRTAIGAGQGSGLANRQRGQTVGSENHTLSVAEMPSHTHDGSSGSTSHGHNGSTLNATHSHGASTSVDNHFHDMHSAISDWNVTDRDLIQDLGGGGVHNVPMFFAWNTWNTTGSDSHGHTVTVNSDTHSHTLSISAESHSHTVTLNNTGSSNAHNNMQPSLVLNYIIRVLA